MRNQRILLIILYAGLSQAAMAAEPRPFELGIVPYLPTSTLVSAYQPLRVHLEERLRRPVVMTTAPDFITFLERCLRKEYDAIILGPGLGRFVQLEVGYHPIAVSRRNIKALVIVDRDASYEKIQDLGGKRVAMLEQMFILSQLGKEVFRKAGMQPERDYRIQVVKTPSNAVHAVLQGEVEAGITTVNLIPQLADDIKHRLRILAESREIPGLMFMQLPPSQGQRLQLQEALLQFERTEAGRKFVQALEMDGLRIPGNVEMKAMDSFLPEYGKRTIR